MELYVHTHTVIYTGSSKMVVAEQSNTIMHIQASPIYSNKKDGTTDGAASKEIHYINDDMVCCLCYSAQANLPCCCASY